jgi:hypothetical protein
VTAGNKIGSGKNSKIECSLWERTKLRDFKIGQEIEEATSKQNASVAEPIPREPEIYK